MAQEQNNKARIQLKHDTEENWRKATGFTPKNGEAIIYDPDANYDHPRLKIGNGNDNVNLLPFIDKEIWEQIQTMNYIDAEEIEDGIVEIRVSSLAPSEGVEF